MSLFRQTMLLLVATLLLSQLVSIGLLIWLPPPRPDYNLLSEVADKLAGRRFDTAEQTNKDRSERSLLLSQATAPPAPSAGMISNPLVTAHFAQHVGVDAKRVRLFYEPDQAPFPFSLRRRHRQIAFRGGEPIFYNSIIAGLDTGHGWRVIRTERPGLVSMWQWRSMIWFGVSFLCLLPIAWLFARRLARPISLLADAANRLGNDINAPPITIRGPIELQTTSDALNGMQRRIFEHLQERTMMIAAIAHDLRTPLARIAFRIEDAPDSIRIPVQADVEQMRAMIAATIGFMKGTSASHVRRPLDLTALIDRLVQAQIDAGSPIAWETTRPAMVDGDEVALIRMFQNLIDNAVQYAGAAEAKMSVNADKVLVTICDRGPGLPEDMLTKVVQPFVRSDPSRNSATGGVGLGLSIANSIALDHGGSFSLTPRPGGGLCANVTLPIRPRQNSRN
jgi:signal transduction histidine kinase